MLKAKEAEIASQKALAKSDSRVNSPESGRDAVGGLHGPSASPTALSGKGSDTKSPVDLNSGPAGNDSSPFGSTGQVSSTEDEQIPSATDSRISAGGKGGLGSDSSNSQLNSGSGPGTVLQGESSSQQGFVPGSTVKIGKSCQVLYENYLVKYRFG